MAAKRAEDVAQWRPRRQEDAKRQEATRSRAIPGAARGLVGAWRGPRGGIAGMQGRYLPELREERRGVGRAHGRRTLLNLPAPGRSLANGTVAEREARSARRGAPAQRRLPARGARPRSRTRSSTPMPESCARSCTAAAAVWWEPAPLRNERGVRGRGRGRGRSRSGPVAPPASRRQRCDSPEAAALHWVDGAHVPAYVYTGDIAHPASSTYGVLIAFMLNV